MFRPSQSDAIMRWIMPEPFVPRPRRSGALGMSLASQPRFFLVKQRLDYTMSTGVTDTSHDTSTNILKIYSRCGVRVTLANKRNMYINESHFSDTFFKRHPCVHEIITLAIKAQFALTF